MNPIEEKITKELELDQLSPTEKEETLLNIGNIIYQEVLMRVLDTMPDADQDEFEKILDNNASPQEIFAFLKEKNPDLEQIITEEATKFKNKASNIMNQIGN